jgi:hypothetical protein
VCSADGGRCVGSQAPECPAVGLPACVNAATGEAQLKVRIASLLVPSTVGLTWRHDP